MWKLPHKFKKKIIIKITVLAARLQKYFLISNVTYFFQNVKKKMYGCTEAFLADAKWILHNCIIYNGGKNMLISLKINLYDLVPVD